MNGKKRSLSQDDQFILLRVTGPINHFISSAGIVIQGNKGPEARKNPSLVLCLWVSVVLTRCVRTSSTLSMRETVTTSGKESNFQGSLMFSFMDSCNTPARPTSEGSHFAPRKLCNGSEGKLDKWTLRVKFSPRLKIHTLFYFLISVLNCVQPRNPTEHIRAL